MISHPGIALYEPLPLSVDGTCGFLLANGICQKRGHPHDHVTSYKTLSWLTGETAFPAGFKERSRQVVLPVERARAGNCGQPLGPKRGHWLTASKKPGPKTYSTRKGILLTTSKSTEADSSPVKAPDENTA